MPTYQVSGSEHPRDITYQLIINAGLHDTNLARVKATRDYLLRCNLVFVVAKISRAITDQSLKSSLFSVMSKNADLEWEGSEGRGMKIAVVCTNSEVVLHFLSLLGW